MISRKKTDLLRVSDPERTKLVWKIRRQTQQKLLEEKLIKALFSSCLVLPYPEAMNPFVEDFAQKAENMMKRNGMFGTQPASLNKH